MIRVRGLGFALRLVAKTHSNNIPDGESLDLRANDQLSGLTDAQCGSRSSTGCRNFNPCGPHITSGLSNVSPETAVVYKYCMIRLTHKLLLMHFLNTCW